MLMDLTDESVMMIFIEVLKEVAKYCRTDYAGCNIAGIAANYFQIGFLFTTETIQFKLEKFDPIKGFKRIFSLRSVVEFLKSILKILYCIGIITFLVIWNRLDEILVFITKINWCCAYDIN